MKKSNKANLIILTVSVFLGACGADNLMREVAGTSVSAKSEMRTLPEDSGVVKTETASGSQVPTPSQPEGNPQTQPGVGQLASVGIISGVLSGVSSPKAPADGVEDSGAASQPIPEPIEHLGLGEEHPVGAQPVDPPEVVMDDSIQAIQLRCCGKTKRRQCLKKFKIRRHFLEHRIENLRKLEHHVSRHGRLHNPHHHKRFLRHILKQRRIANYCIFALRNPLKEIIEGPFGFPLELSVRKK